MTTNVGIAVRDRPGADELRRDADIALYEAKAAGKDCDRVFTDDIRPADARRRASQRRPRT